MSFWNLIRRLWVKQTAQWPAWVSEDQLRDIPLSREFQNQRLQPSALEVTSTNKSLWNPARGKEPFSDEVPAQIPQAALGGLPYGQATARLEQDDQPLRAYATISRALIKTFWGRPRSWAIERQKGYRVQQSFKTIAPPKAARRLLSEIEIGAVHDKPDNQYC